MGYSSGYGAGQRSDPWASLVRSVDPVAELMTTAEAKVHLRVDHSDEDDYINTLVEAARWAVEEQTSRATTTQTWVMKLDAFPSGDEIRLPRPPLASVTSVAYVDGAGDTQTFSSADYTVSVGGDLGRIKLAYGDSWPSTRAQPEAVTITYIAGYGAAASAVPAALVHAAKLIVGDLYALREGSLTGTIHVANPAVDALLAPFVVRYY